jgi:hypothetical protein
MPITPPGMAAAIATGMASVGFTGLGIPQYSAGVAAGVSLWLPQVQVVSADTGTVGAGSTTVPFVLPPPLLISALLASYPSSGHVGIMTPLEATGLGNGLATGFALGILQLIHPSVGVGTGIAKFVAPPPIPSILAGFASVGMTGMYLPLKAQAISQALLTVFSAYTLPIPIVGPTSPFPSTGVGTGKVL